jgi:Histidine kinase
MLASMPMLMRAESYAVRGVARWSAPLSATWRDVWITITPVWAMLAASRVLFYALERQRYPDIIAPVLGDTIQTVLLWPLVVLGCLLTLRSWTRAGLMAAVGVCAMTTLVFGTLARPAYAAASFLLTGDPGFQSWIEILQSPAYAWASNALEYGALYFSSVAVTAGFLSFRSLMNERLLRSRVEAAAAHERLRALRTQLNPHFLFNTLNSIVGLGDIESSSARQLITRLSELLRRTLLASECDEQPLRDELAHAEAYLHIQQIRQPSRIAWQVRSDPSCATASVPSLILLPLIENAVTHGLRGGENHVAIQIAVECGPQALQLRVSNSCPVRAPESRARSPGLGLRNVRERLEVMFGAQASLVTGRSSASQFTARITLPLRERAAAVPGESR